MTSKREMLVHACDGVGEQRLAVVAVAKDDLGATVVVFCGAMARAMLQEGVAAGEGHLDAVVG